jgi:hypothetical protein
VIPTCTRSRRGSRVLVAFSAALAGLLMVAEFAPAVAWSPDPVLGGPMFRPSQALTFRWGNADTMPQSMKTAVANGAVDASASRLSLAPTYAWSSTGSNVVWYGGNVPCSTYGIACFQRNAPTGFTLWFREDGHRFDFGPLRWCEVENYPDSCPDAETVMLDELGHVDDLDHHVNLPDESDWTDAVMQALVHGKPGPGWQVHAFERCDVATLQSLYDVLSATTPYSTCSDIPTTLSIAATKTSVTAWSPVGFTATLTSHGPGLLDGNAVAGRTVVLQQRSGTSWVDIATMSAGTVAGSYVASLNLWSTTDFRAIFRKPVFEGLRGSTSSTVTIVVTGSCTISCPTSPRGIS